MPVIDALGEDNGVAFAVAAALEVALGGDTIVTVGLPRVAAPSAENLPAGPLRMVSVGFHGTESGVAALLVDAPTALALEAAAPDEQMTTSVAAVVVEAATQVTRLVDGGATLDAPAEDDPADLLELADDADFVVYPFLVGVARVAALVVATGRAFTPAAAAGTDTPPSAPDDLGAPPAAFAPGAPAHPLSLLQRVEMGVTAELGRRRMSIRELLTLAPGSVIELDRAAGSPVDVLVNGTLIARGEVVVIDEEFGIRISEILADAGEPSVV